MNIWKIYLQAIGMIKGKEEVSDYKMEFHKS